MFYWHTATIVEALKRIKNVDKILVQDPGGDVDSENLIVYVKGTDDQLWVCGFITDDGVVDPAGACDVEMIELTDGLSSSGGLNSTNANLAIAYTRIRQYFVDNGAEVVPTHKAYF